MDLVLVKKQNKEEVPLTTSKIIAERTKNTHDSVQKLISRHEADFLEFGKVGFEIRPSARNQPEKIYYLNENQALLLITYMRNNEIVRKLKIALVTEFSKMKNIILSKQTAIWKDIRELGKGSNSDLMDTVKEFVEYAKSQGSSQPERYYLHFSKLTNSALAIGSGERDFLERKQMNHQIFMNDLLIKEIKAQMELRIPYKAAYKNCKAKINLFMSYVNT